MANVDPNEIEHIDLSEVEAPPQHSKKSLHAAPAVETREEYKKFAYTLIGILFVACFLTTIRGWSVGRFMGDFMAVFFITFAGFKFADIEGFVHGYRNYDILAKNIRPWAYIFPFIEAFLGFWYLLSEAPTSLNLLTLIITGTASIGVFREINQKSRFMCACLGTVIRLPLSRVSLVENVSMFVMAAIMLFL